MRTIAKGLLVSSMSLILAACVAPSVVPDSPALNEAMAERNYQIGDEVEKISDIRLQDRSYIDPQNLILPAEGGSDFLVNLKHPCYGLKANRIKMRSGRYHALQKYDRFTTIHEQTNVDYCYVEAIYKLDPRQ